MKRDILSIDIETYSSVDLKTCGLYKYVQADDFQILLLAYAWNDDPVEIVDLASGEALPKTVQDALCDPAVEKHAFNAPFEIHALKRVYATETEQWRCTMFHALYCGYPGSLAAVSQAIGLPNDKKKLSTGTALIRYFSVPCKPTRTNGERTRNLPHHEPEKWRLFKEYCKQDVEAERAISQLLADFAPDERDQADWVLDQRMNASGIHIDQDFIAGATACDERAKIDLLREAQRLTGLDNPASDAQLKVWLEEQEGFAVESLAKSNVESVLERVRHDKSRRALAIRGELRKTSTRKYPVMQQAAGEDGRIRGLLQFYGANRTGRWAGRLVQVHNLPRNYLPDLDLARQLVKAKQTDAIRMLFGSVADTLSQLVRTAFVAPEGHSLMVADFSAIEARVIAWLAGETWRQEVFASHGKIYEASASQMFGVPLEKITKGNPEYALRQKGKVAELALGYQGGANALINMGALDNGLSEEELPDIVARWRAASPAIVGLWKEMERAAVHTVKTGNPAIVRGVFVQRQMAFNKKQSFLTIRLPSGRKLFYVRPFLAPGTFGKDALHYWGVNQTTRKWEITPTYGGKLVENVVQAIARDCLAAALRRVSGAGYRTVMHIHDEIVVEHPTEQCNLNVLLTIMREPIEWAPGLLLNADGFVSDYYKKE